MRAPTLLLLAGLVACAGPDEGGRKLIRPGGEGDFGRDRGLVDAAPPPPDAEGSDASDPDAAPPPGAPAVWYVLRHDDPATGLRAALQPPQRPAGEGLATSAPAPVLVRWAGPGSPGEAALVALQAEGRPAAPLYELEGRADAAAADASWLAAHHLQHPRALRVGERPVLAIAPAPDRAGLTALNARLEALPVQPYLVLEVGVEARPWPAADAILPRTSYGEPLDPQGDFGDERDEIARAAARAAALAAGWAWLPRASPGGNRRLADPDAPVPDEAGALTRSLVLAREARVPALPIVVVDGLGAWRDDRQVDPVSGEATDAPAELTGGQRLAAYGAARLDAVARLLGPPCPAPGGLGAGAPVLLGRAGAATLVDDGEGLVASGAGLWLLEGRPTVLPAGVQLAYRRASTDVQVDLRFDDGTSLADRLPPSEAEGEVRLPLDGFAGRVVDAVVVRAAAAGRVTRPSLLAVRGAAGP
ncbi:MAG: hypothetical protein R3F60_10235 [bacterium]